MGSGARRGSNPLIDRLPQAPRQSAASFQLPRPRSAASSQGPSSSGLIEDGTVSAAMPGGDKCGGFMIKRATGQVAERVWLGVSDLDFHQIFSGFQIELARSCAFEKERSSPHFIFLAVGHIARSSGP